MASNLTVMQLAFAEAKRLSLTESKGEAVVVLFNNDIKEPEYTMCPESGLAFALEVEPYLTEVCRFLNGEKIS